MSENAEATPVLPHLAPEFYLWLWWRSETGGGSFDLGEEAGRIDLWIDDRLAFRIPGDKKVTAVLTGENPSESLEAKAALYGGKVLNEVRLRIKRDDRDFVVTLKGPELHMTRISLPQALQDSPEEAIYDRLFLYDELWFVIGSLFQTFTDERLSDAWAEDTVPALRAWVEGEAAQAG
ncbi:MAG: hypothetical protein AB8H79_20455 [Myxococcota bacterium]